MKEGLNILILEDDLVFQNVIRNFLQKKHRVKVSMQPSQAFEVLEEEGADILISDFRLPEMDGIQFIKKVKDKYPAVEIIMMSSFADADVVIDAMRTGAIDFFKKPFDLNELTIALKRTEKYIKLQQNLSETKLKKEALEKELQASTGYEIIGESKEILEVKDIISKVASAPDTSILISGESGTGKELVARGIHEMSARKNEYFAAVNTSAIPENLFESEFFGHKRGAFTGAEYDKPGWFEVANKGSLFLDEIGDMPLPLQIKLLRVLEERSYIKVGETRENHFDIRIISATNKNYEEMKGGKVFRSDLFHRLSTFIIHIPPLRERKSDIPLLVSHFIKYFNDKLKKNIKPPDPSFLEALKQYPFPGNVRELRNMIERAVILSDGDTLKANLIPEINNFDGNEKVTDAPFETLNLETIERSVIKMALEKASYNKAEAARLLNIEWNALHRRILKYKL